MGNDASLHLIADLKDLPAIHKFINDRAVSLGVDPLTVYDVHLVVTEMVSNTIIHGYQGVPGPVEIEMGREGDSLVIRLRDKTPPFDPTQMPPPDLSTPLDERPVGGLGIHLTRNFVDRFEYRYSVQTGNEITLVKEGVFSNSSREEDDGHGC
ncbi:MAG: ATP-binding protein [Acidobacteriaceae bacterium]